MRNDIKAINEAYFKSTRPKKDEKEEYDERELRKRHGIENPEDDDDVQDDPTFKFEDDEHRQPYYQGEDPHYYHDINGRKITIFDVPTVNKTTDEEELVTYTFNFSHDDQARDLTDRRFEMYVDDREVDPRDYYVDESEAAGYAYQMLVDEGEIERQYHG